MHTSVTTISTDALYINNGELTLGPLNITSNGGSNFAIYDESIFGQLGSTMDGIKNDMAQANQNMKRAKSNSQSLNQENIKPPSDAKGVLDEAKESIKGLSDSLKSIKIR